MWFLLKIISTQLVMVIIVLENVYGKGIEQNNQWSLKTVINPSWFDRLQFSVQIVLISNDSILGLISSHAISS